MFKYFYVIIYKCNLSSYFTAQPGERGSDAVNYEDLGGNNAFKNSFAMWWRYELSMEQSVLIFYVFKWILGNHSFKNILMYCLYDVDMVT